MATRPQRVYVVDYSSLVEATRLQPPARSIEVLRALAELARAGRLKCVSTAWDKVKKQAPIKAAFRGCSTLLVVKVVNLLPQFRAIMPLCGTTILTYDAIDEDPDPWTAALAYHLKAPVVLEPNVLRRLAPACVILRLDTYDLDQLAALESI